VTTWISHLRIAESLLDDIPGLDHEAFAIGNLAPDSGVPNENWTDFDPPPSVTHFHPPGKGHLEIQDLAFFHEYVEADYANPSTSPSAAFLWGYFFHLVTDRLWMIRVAEPKFEAFGSGFESKADYLSEAKRDWYGLDFDFIRQNPDCLFWRLFVHASLTVDPLPFLPATAISQNLAYIKKLYQREDPEIESIYIARPNIYLQKPEMDNFVKAAVRVLGSVSRSILIDGVSFGREALSVLEIEPFSEMAIADR